MRLLTATNEQKDLEKGPLLYKNIGMKEKGAETTEIVPYLRTCAPNADSGQRAHLRSLIRIFTGRILDSQGCKVSSCGKRRL